MYTRTCRECKEQFQSDLPQKVLCTTCKADIERRRGEGKNARSKQYYKDNKEERKVAIRRYRREYHAATYGMTADEYDTYRLSRDTCVICDEPFKDSRDRQVDHCHKSGKVRGLLCRLCNLGLGKFRDNPELLRKAANYLGG